jgi:hypothetical protein
MICPHVSFSHPLPHSFTSRFRSYAENKSVTFCASNERNKRKEGTKKNPPDSSFLQRSRFNSHPCSFPCDVRREACDYMCGRVCKVAGNDYW